MFGVAAAARIIAAENKSVCCQNNRDLCRIADELAPDLAWPTDEPLPDLSRLWETSRGMRPPGWKSPNYAEHNQYRIEPR